MSILKKFVILAVIFSFIYQANFQNAFAYPDYVAVISNYQDVKTRIKIHRANGEPSGSKSLLYPGDKITGDVGDIKIERGPYADFHNVDNKYYLISYNPPIGFDKLANEFYEITKLFWQKVDAILVDNHEETFSAKTRGSESNLASLGFNLNPRPGFKTTLINNEKIIFAGVSKQDKFGRLAAPKNYVIKDSSGQEIYRGNFDKNGEDELDLSSKNFKVGEKYTWIVDGSTEYDFTILDEETAKIIQKYFSEIDAKKISAENKNLEKAFFAQKISDNSEGKINLYWLSAQLLIEISPKTDDSKLEKYMLLKKYHDHLMEELDEYLK